MKLHLQSVTSHEAFCKTKCSQAWAFHFMKCLVPFFSRDIWWVPVGYPLGIVRNFFSQKIMTILMLSNALRTRSFWKWVPLGANLGGHLLLKPPCDNIINLKIFHAMAQNQGKSSYLWCCAHMTVAESQLHPTKYGKQTFLKNQIRAEEPNFEQVHHGAW